MATGAPMFDTSYARLPERFFARVQPAPARQPELIRANAELALELGMDPQWLSSAAGVQMVAGNAMPGNADPIATVYAGHQFGGWNPQLGDGRALLLGEVIGNDGQRYDIQLKGSGRTPYSRGGDGRAPLGPVLREYLVSEAMSAMGVPSSRSLSAVTTGEPVMRDGVVLPGAVLARVASSHIRIGTMQYFAARQDHDALKILADHVIARHYPWLENADHPYLALFEAIVQRQAGLVAQWQAIGFIHGVMNTDNMLLCGETIDYGPCAFMDYFDPAAVYSSIDHAGRYAYRNQPGIAHWNLSCLAGAMLPLLGEDQEQATALLTDALNSFVELFSRAYHVQMLRKLGLTEDNPASRELLANLLGLMAAEKADFTQVFRRLAELANPNVPETIESQFEFSAAFKPWLERWRGMAGLDDDSNSKEPLIAMLCANPVFIPRNHLVEETIVAAVQEQNFKPFHQLADILQNPYCFDSQPTRYALPPTPEQLVSSTFCGT